MSLIWVVTALVYNFCNTQLNPLITMEYCRREMYYCLTDQAKLKRKQTLYTAFEKCEKDFLYE